MCSEVTVFVTQNQEAGVWNFEDVKVTSKDEEIPNASFLVANCFNLRSIFLELPYSTNFRE